MDFANRSFLFQFGMKLSSLLATALPLTLRSITWYDMIYDMIRYHMIFKHPLWRVFLSMVLVGLEQLQRFVVSSLAYSHSDADVLNQSLLEANIATEVCLTVLDTLSSFIMGFKVTYITILVTCILYLQTQFVLEPFFFKYSV